MKIICLPLAIVLNGSTCIMYLKKSRILSIIQITNTPIGWASRKFYVTIKTIVDKFDKMLG